MSDEALLVVDLMSGINKKAVVRWRLNPGVWTIHGNEARGQDHTLKVTSDVNIVRFEIVKAEESRYYYQKTVIPVLEIEIQEDGEVVTQYKYI